MNAFTYPQDITPKAITEAQQQIRDFLSGAASLPMAGESGIVDAATAVRTAGKALIDKKQSDRLGWLQFTWGAAVVRGVNYARAGRGRMLALGANNALQELYEEKNIAKRGGAK
jgi:hypothetical protein